MVANRFDDLLRALTPLSSRRSVAGALSGLLLSGQLGGPLGLIDADAKKKRKKKNKKRRCQSGTRRCGKTCIPETACCSNADCGPAPCHDGVCDCTLLPNGTNCGGDRQCFNGGCGTPPTCLPTQETCLTSSQCCSGACAGGQCGSSFPGQTCHSDDDCFDIATSCIGFVCLCPDGTANIPCE